METPPIPDYLQDGESVDETKRFEVQYTDTRAFMKTLLQKQRKKKAKDDEADS